MSSRSTINFSLPLLAVAFALAGCQLTPARPAAPPPANQSPADDQSRSISNSGFSDADKAGLLVDPLFRPELTEADIFGRGTRPTIGSGETLGRVIPKPKRGDRVVLVQSGVQTPDELMLTEAAHYFSAATFSGVPPPDGSGLAVGLRQHAAQGDYRFVIFYWGVIDFAPPPVEMHTVRLEPIPAPGMPDQKQQMSILLTALVLDVTTGEWIRIAPDPYFVTRYSSGWSVKASDEELVRSLKAEGYRSLLDALVQK